MRAIHFGMTPLPRPPGQDGPGAPTGAAPVDRAVTG
ncbi:hypothetical protein KRIGEM_02076 [Komagataeibacter rhaeticus]|nr:hypothetical protein KRIGEM_02076 [Komagataeibacter rhaeticus]